MSTKHNEKLGLKKGIDVKEYTKSEKNPELLETHITGRIHL